MADTYQSNYTGLEIDERLGWAEEIVPHKEDKSNPHGVTATQINAVPTTRTVNSKALSSDITLSASDVGALSTTDAGDLAELTTTEKGSLVGAINELNTDKIGTAAIANTLTETAEGKVLDARQGKALKDLVDTNTQFTDVDNVVYSWRFIKSAEGHMQLEYMEVI
jgi:hypothetical protein